MVPTQHLLSFSHGKSGGFLGYVIAFLLTGLAHLLSEFPSLRTGFTEEPKALPYLALISFS
jgi:hypothetical protein